jgi:hypothetical protein
MVIIDSKKFRGKRKDNKEWVFGYYLFDDFDDYIFVLKNKNKEDGPWYWHKVITETVGIYVGLDQSDEEIWANDIVEAIYESPVGDQKITGIVVWNQADYRFDLQLTDSSIALCVLSEIRKVGNTFDNSEILIRKD